MYFLLISKVAISSPKVRGWIMSHRLNTIIYKYKGSYYGDCPELEERQSQGSTMDVTIGNMKEAIELYVETLD